MESNLGGARLEAAEDQRLVGCLATLVSGGGSAERERAERDLNTALWPRLVRRVLAQVRGLRVEDAEEIASDAVMTLLARPERFQPGRTTVLCFATGIARRLALRRLRRMMREPRRADLAEAETIDVPGATELAEPAAAPNDRYRALLAALAALPDHVRSAVLMEADGHRPAAIAAMTGRTPAYTRLAIHRGKRRLQRALKAAA
jgi:RNA polymerase sigma factor (sigma-70 family)